MSIFFIENHSLVFLNTSLLAEGFKLTMCNYVNANICSDERQPPLIEVGGDTGYKKTPPLPRAISQTVVAVVSMIEL